MFLNAYGNSLTVELSVKNECLHRIIGNIKLSLGGEIKMIPVNLQTNKDFCQHRKFKINKENVLRAKLIAYEAPTIKSLDQEDTYTGTTTVYTVMNRNILETSDKKFVIAGEITNKYAKNPPFDSQVELAHNISFKERTIKMLCYINLEKQNWLF